MSNIYTSLEISKLIYEKVPEVDIHKEQWENECEWVGGYDGCSRVVNRYPKYRLDDVMRAVNVWGEKQGKLGVCNHCGAENKKDCLCIDGGLEDWDVWTQHLVLSNYIADNLSFGEHSEKLLREIFK